MQAGRAAPVDVGVGYNGAPARQADLAAVGVPGQCELVAVRLERVQDAAVGRVEQAEGQVRVRVRGAGSGICVRTACGQFGLHYGAVRTTS
mgnify:CR=1 FL=1